jgi:peptide/nickel transport system permease protein
MLAYIVRRLLYSIPVLVAASIITFFGVSSVGDPLGELRMQPNISQTTIDNIVERKHLDEPLAVRYGYWVKEAVTEQFGSGVIDNQPIGPELMRAIGRTLQLVVGAQILAAGIAFVLGTVSAKRQYSVLDNVTTFGSFVGYSIPVFWAALVLQVAVTNFYNATGVRLFYTAGLSSVDPGTGFSFFVDRLQHLALPILALSITGIAAYSRYMRASMLEVLNSDYIRTARAKGLADAKVTYRHAVRNALIPVTTVFGLNFGQVLGGAIIIETIFGIPGMGLYYFDNLIARDVYPIMAWMMVTAAIVIVFNLVTDIFYGYLDPRIRYD